MSAIHRRDAIAVAAVALLAVGLVGPAAVKAQKSDKQRQGTNNLKQIGLAFHTHNDVVNYLPFNGGHTDPAQLKTINYGWHHENITNSGTWVTMLLPFVEQKALWKSSSFMGEAHDKVPVELTDKDFAGRWRITVKVFNCPERGRVGFKTGVGKTSMPGVVSDYAINTFINDPPTMYSMDQAKRQTCYAQNGGLACKENVRMTIQGISDGSSNTILAGQKSLAAKQMLPNADADGGDEGIFSPGHYTPAKDKTTVKSSGTGRGHRIDPAMKAFADQATMPAGGGVPWSHADKDLAGDKLPDFASDWGTPFADGTLFLMGDGTVRMIPAKLNGTLVFAWMLYPSDGNVIPGEDNSGRKTR